MHNARVAPLVPTECRRWRDLRGVLPAMAEISEWRVVRHGSEMIGEQFERVDGLPTF